MSADEVIATEAIRQTIARYNVAGDQRDAAMFIGLWDNHAVLEFDGFGPLPGFRCEGIAEINASTAGWKPRSGNEAARGGTSFVRHNLTTSLIELSDAETARAITYFIVMTDIGTDHSGTYADRLVRRGDRWLFAHRHISLDWRNPDSLFPRVPK